MTYWERHKKVFLELLDGLDPDIRDQIMADPGCEAAQELDNKVRIQIGENESNQA